MKITGLIKKNARLFRNMAALAAAAAVLAVVQPGSAAVGVNTKKAKSETVYAVLENDGAYGGATVVNCFLSGGEISDFGQYISVKNVTGTEKPDIDGDSIKWNTNSAPFYYEGETVKKLPFTVSISYYFNGSKTDPRDIAGKTGELKIEFTVKNETGTGETDELTERELMTPLAVSTSLTLSNDSFTVTDKPKNASCVLVGAAYTLSYASFPLPEDTFSFTMFGKDIELDPINIVVVPKSPPGLDSFGAFVDVDGIKEGADEMLEGAGDMRSGVGDLLEALKEMRDAAKLLKDGIYRLSDGADGLSDGAGELYHNAKQLKASANEFYTGFSDFTAGVASLKEGVEIFGDNAAGMCVQLSQLAEAAAQLDTGVININGGLGSISGSNAALAALADAYDDIYPISDLTSGLQGQQAVIDGLVTASGDLITLSGNVSAGAQDFYTGFSTTLASSVQQLETSYGELYAACLELLEGAGALNQGCAQISGALRGLSSGAEELSDGAAEISAKLPGMISGIEEMTDGVEELYEGIGELNDEGLKELKESFDGLEGYLDKLSDKAAAYGSFMDERNAESSTVQFVLKTKGIGQQ